MKKLFPIALILGLFGQSATAHHSASSFDHAHPVDVHGTVNKFLWGNPHTWLYVLTPNGHGGSDVWEIEGPSVTTLVRNGWTNNSLKSGDKITVSIAPRRDGSPGGTMYLVTRADGSELSSGRL